MPRCLGSTSVLTGRTSLLFSCLVKCSRNIHKSSAPRPRYDRDGPSLSCTNILGRGLSPHASAERIFAAGPTATQHVRIAQQLTSQDIDPRSAQESCQGPAEKAAAPGWSRSTDMLRQRTFCGMSAVMPQRVGCRIVSASTNSTEASCNNT